jgi:hypothetical protein
MVVIKRQQEAKIPVSKAFLATSNIKKHRVLCDETKNNGLKFKINLLGTILMTPG